MTERFSEQPPHDQIHHERLLQVAARFAGRGLPSASYEVLNLTAEGLSADEIVMTRQTTKSTVLDQQKKLRDQLNADSNSEAIYNAIETGLLPVYVSEDATPPDGITEREVNAMRDLVASLTVQQSADKHFVNRATMQRARGSYYEKIGARSAEHAVRRSYEVGIFPKPNPAAYAPAPSTRWQEVPLLTPQYDRRLTEIGMSYDGLPMTTREVEVLNLQAAGLTTKQIAAIPDMSPNRNTIRGLASRILRSMNVQKTTDAVHIGARTGMVPIKRSETDVFPYMNEGEFRLLRYCLYGYSSNQMSEIEGWSPIKLLDDRAALWEKFGVANNNHLVKRTYEVGLLPLPSKLPLSPETKALFASSVALKAARKYGLL